MSQNEANINNNIPMQKSQNDVPSVVTKLCHIIKRPDFDGYGFNLHSEKSKPGQYIGKVDPNSPAELGGLKEGDRILKVNDVSIENETHKQVVQRIKAIANEVRLLLVDTSGTKNNDKVNDNQIIDSLPLQEEHVKQVGNNSNVMEDVNSKVNTPAQQNMMFSNNRITNDTTNSTKTGSLQLPITAAEMRAKLLSKKKYDPKNESVDLKKKFEIIQKL